MTTSITHSPTLPDAMDAPYVDPVFELDTRTYAIPALFADGGPQTMYHFIEFFSATIENEHTRRAYITATLRFARWCERHGVSLPQLNPVVVSRYTNELKDEQNPDGKLSAPSIRQHMAALRMLFDHLVVNHIIPFNPTFSVKRPKHVTRVGKTPVLQADEMSILLESINTSTISGLRDKALIGVMAFSFARINAAVGMNVEDYYREGLKQWNFRFLEKGGQDRAVAAHHKAQEFLDAYLEVAGIGNQPKSPLFRSLNRKRQLTERRLHPQEALAMVKRRARGAGLPENICNHTFRATGITDYLTNGGMTEIAQYIAGHASAETTKKYDRRKEEVSQAEIERIRFGY